MAVSIRTRLAQRRKPATRKPPNATTALDAATLPAESWWIGLSRQQLHDAVATREAERMRSSRFGACEFGSVVGAPHMRTTSIGKRVQ